ncbi:MAG TPA: HEAT repeat domain-containing protein [Planctomycetota bacterium]|nr:HEAT repeat domain-containing protein [Planctomycetota bacterium]
MPLRRPVVGPVLLAAALASVAALGGCSSGGASGSSPAGARSREATSSATPRAASSGGSLWDRLDRAHAERQSPKESGFVGEADGASQVAPDVRARLEGWWRAYATHASDWPALKAQWLAAPPPAPALLAENLLRAHVFAWDAGDRREYERSRRELAAMPEIAAPLLVEGLAQRAGDAVVRNHAAELLGAMGPSALPAITRGLENATPRGRWDLVRAVARMKDPGTTDFLTSVLFAPGAYEPRMEAVKGLAENGDPRAYDAVVRALQDGDPSVRKFAARYVAGFGRDEAAPALVACMELCERERDREGVEEAHVALRKVTGVDCVPESGAWRARLASRSRAR